MVWKVIAAHFLLHTAGWGGWQEECIYFDTHTLATLEYGRFRFLTDSMEDGRYNAVKYTDRDLHPVAPLRCGHDKREKRWQKEKKS